MTTNSSHDDGSVSQAELAYVRRRCASEFAMSITACAYVHDGGRSWRGIGAARPRQLASLCEVAAAFRCGGGLAMLQLYDGGRISNPELVGEAELRAPSAIPSSRPGAKVPREMSDSEVVDVLGAFVRSARLARAADFDGVELHGANHYLLHQFFSPRANHRSDRWGGDLERRMRFPIDVAAAVRKALGSTLTLGFKINPLESEPGGFTLDEAAELCARLAHVGVDYIHISMDDFRARSPMREDRDWTTGTRPPQELRSPVTTIRDAVGAGCAVIAGGGVRTIDHAKSVMEAGADLVAVGRAPLIDPDWLSKMMNGAENSVRDQLPANRHRIATELTIPEPMADYLLSRPGWIPREPSSS